MPALVTIAAVEALRKAVLEAPLDSFHGIDSVHGAAEHLLDEVYGGDWWREDGVKLHGIRIDRD